MQYKSDKCRRRSIRLRRYDYSQAGAYFVTICTKDRECLFGNIVDGDMVMVTSSNEQLTVFYIITLATGFESLPYDHIKLYPNPTNSDVHIEGLKPGSRIRVYSVMGAMLRDVYSKDPHTVLSLDMEAAGMYLIVISDMDNTPVGKYKVLKK